MMRVFLCAVLVFAAEALTGEGSSMMIIAHRGASGKEPENTMRAFKKAIDVNADMIEFDVHACASGEIVIIHDDTLERTTDGVGDVAKSTLAGLQRLNAGEGEPIPTLQKVLEELRGKIKLDIELKGQHTGAPVARLLHQYIYHHKWPVEDIVVTSFRHDELLKLHEIMPIVQLGTIFDEGHSIVYEDLPVQYIVVWHDDLTSDVVQKAHEKNIKVFTYTVNENQDVTHAVRCGVDGIITDNPDFVRSLIQPSQESVV